MIIFFPQNKLEQNVTSSSYKHFYSRHRNIFKHTVNIYWSRNRHDDVFPYQTLLMNEYFNVEFQRLVAYVKNSNHYFVHFMCYRVKKTNCLINAGLSHACDNMDTLNTIHEGLYLGSSDTPGRK